MRVLGERVLIEQTSTKIDSKIIKIGGDAAKHDFVVVNKVLAVGDRVKNPEIEIGEIPIFGAYIDLGNMKIISKTDNKIVAHIIVMYEDIIGVDDVIPTK